MLPRNLVIWVTFLVILSNPLGCRVTDQPPPAPSPLPTPSSSISVPLPGLTPLLQASWETYRKRFIQADGRVIDWEANQRTTSEGQAYALLRAVIVNDPETFDRVLTWAENNLRRRDQANTPPDRLWAWQWGKTPAGTWGMLDRNFASDADIDTITALILADRRWQRPAYRQLAEGKLQDLWALSTVVDAKQHRYLLPGPLVAFRQDDRAILNPSYFAPYAFRLFAQVDPAHDWLKLVDSSYQVLTASAALSKVGLPSDWIGLDLKTGQVKTLATAKPGPSQYGFDATRVWWRVAIDAAAFQEPRAKQYLKQHLAHLKTLWQTQQKIPAQIDLQGLPLVDYEATSQYGMLHAAFQVIDPPIAQAIYQQKLLPAYRQGFWDNDSAYYTQNLVWLGLLPPDAIVKP